MKEVYSLTGVFRKDIIEHGEVILLGLTRWSGDYIFGFDWYNSYSFYVKNCENTKTYYLEDTSIRRLKRKFKERKCVK